MATDKERMSFSELLEILHGLRGKIIEATIDVSVLDIGGCAYKLQVASFGGTVDGCREGSEDRRDVYRLWLSGSGPEGGAITFDPATFIDGDYESTREESDYAQGEFDPDDRTGTMWVLRVEHAGVLTTINVYVV